MLRLTALLLLSATGHCFQLSHVPRTPALRSRPILASVAEQPPPPDESEEEKRARLARCTEARTPDLCATACVHAMGSVPVQEAIGREAAAEKNYLDSAPADDGGLMAEFQARIDAEGGANVFKAKSAANDVTEQAKEAANKAKARDRPDCRAHGMLAAPPPPRWPHPPPLRPAHDVPMVAHRKSCASTALRRVPCRLLRAGWRTRPRAWRAASHSSSATSPWSSSASSPSRSSSASSATPCPVAEAAWVAGPPATPYERLSGGRADRQRPAQRPA